jgi:predicted RNase H-like HicB family nuclease
VSVALVGLGWHTRTVADQGFIVELEREEDGRWIAEVPRLPGVMVYGQSREEAMAKVEALALRVLADRLEHGEAVPEVSRLFFAAA